MERVGLGRRLPPAAQCMEKQGNIHPERPALGRLSHSTPTVSRALFLRPHCPSLPFPSAAPCSPLDFQQVTQQLPHNHDDWSRARQVTCQSQ